jgi:glucose/mannose-6-phosphate isomerase
LSRLDAPETYSREPFRRALEIAADYIHDFREGLENGRRASVTAKSIEKIIFLGIGGSGIICDAAARLLSGSGVKKIVQRSYGLGSLNWDLAIAVSHSGNTAETVKPVMRLMDAGVSCIFVTSGGALMKLAEKYGVPVIPVRADVPPRYAFPSMLGAALGALEALGVIRISLDYGELEHYRAGLGEDVPSERNPVKRLAERIASSYLVIYAYNEVREAGYRLKCQLNENAKMHCCYAEFPEALHNDLEALPDNALVIIPRSMREPPEISRTIDALGGLLGEERILSIRAGARDEAEELLKLFMFMDYTSLYAAVLRGVDPLSVPRMSRLKKLNPVYGEVIEEVERRVAGR